MGNSMKKFKKLAVFAITIPTLLSSTNISFAMKSPVQSNVHAPQRQTIHIPLNQLYLDGQGSVLFNPNVPYDNTYCFITIQPNFTPTNTLNIYIVNSLRHDEYGCIYYANGQPVQITLPQQLETITQGQYYYDTVDNSPFEQEEIQEQNEQVEDNKSPKPPKSTQKTAKTRKYCKDEQTFKLDENGKVVKTEYKDCIRCKEKKCVVKNGTFVRRGIKMQRYLCKKCQKNFILYENGKVVKKELKDCIRCKEKECAAKNGTYKLRNGTKKQLYFCTKCKKYFTQPINKNAEEQAGIEIQPN